MHEDRSAAEDRPKERYRDTEALAPGVTLVTTVRRGVDPCDVACEAMPAFVLGDLPVPDREWVEDHTAICNYCRNELDRFTRVDEVLEQCCQIPEAALERQVPVLSLPHRDRAYYGEVESPIGNLLLAVSERGVCEVAFARNHSLEEFQAGLEARGFVPIADPGAVTDAAAQLTEYFGGQRNGFDLQIDFRGVTPFVRDVLEATADVPFGGLTTYRDIAQRIGRPRATRAVGNALGRNPVPVIVPYHRVIRSDATIGGYTGGLEIKRQLLVLEGATIHF